MPTFEDVYRSVLLQAPEVPLMTARKWVIDTYLQLSGRRGWNFLRQEGSLSVLASRTLTVGVTIADATVTSAALFLATDGGRQFRIGTGETFTILTFTSTSSIELDRPYTGDTAAAASATILDAYATMPADFGRFETLVDPLQQRRLAWWVSQDQLNGSDPLRQTSGAPRCLSPITPSPTGRARYEWWPRPANAQVYPMLYLKRGAQPADTDSLQGVFAERPDLLEAGALVQAARYPGTKDQPNGYFNLALARELQAEFEALAQQLNLRDDDLAPQDYVADERWTRLAGWEYAASLKTLRETDYAVGDYYGSFY